VSDSKRALTEDLEPEAEATADASVTREAPQLEALLDEPENGEPDDTEIPAELLGSPRNDAPRTASEVAMSRAGIGAASAAEEQNLRPSTQSERFPSASQL
jgi:hypothetical protein